MARRYSRRRGHRGFKIPILSTAILVGQAALAWERGGHNLMGAANQFQQFYTGFDFVGNQFYAPYLAIGYAPWLVKGLVMKVARPLGAAPRLPVKGLPVSFS